MPSVRGFALLLSFLLVLILTIFGYWMLLIAEKHYAASRSLYDSENARIISQAEATLLVLQHNSEEPRFFTDFQKWNDLQLKPYVRNEYHISGGLAAPWTSAPNLMRLRVKKARSFASLELPIRQIRFEDFAFFSDQQQTLSASALFDGIVFARGGLFVSQPVRFRKAVHNDVSPAFNASYRKVNRMWLNFSFPSNSPPVGLNITAQDPRFWQIDHYELNLDNLEILPKGLEWEIGYNGVSIGQTSTLALNFDRSVYVSQSFSEVAHLPTGKSQATLYIVSSEDIVIASSIRSLHGSQYENPLCFYSARQTRVVSNSCAVRIMACLIASGEPSLLVETGTTPVSTEEKQSWISEIRGSVFVLEPERKAELLEAIQTNQKIAWFRGSIGIKGTFVMTPDISQVHFEACRAVHHLIPSFPFIQVVEGEQKWQ